jgi:hypothetical protein
VGSGM